MKQRSVLGLTVVALALALTPIAGAAQSAKDLIGAWAPVSVPTYDPNPKGMLIFDANGHVSVQLMRANLPKYASNSRLEGTPDEYKATGQGALSYYGTYSVNGTDLLIHIEACSFPNWAGNQKRANLKLAGDELSWTNPAPSAGGPPSLVVWKRAK